MKYERILFLSITIILGISLGLIIGFVEALLYSWWKMLLTVGCFSAVMGSFCTDSEKDMIPLAIFSLLTFIVITIVSVLIINNLPAEIDTSEEVILAFYNSTVYLQLVKPAKIAYAAFIALLIGCYQMFISTLTLWIRMVYVRFVSKQNS